MDETIDEHRLTRGVAGTILETLGVRIVDAGRERVELELDVGPHLHQPYGYVHGGVSVVLAETCASIGALLAAGPDMVSMGVEIDANHLRPVREGRLRAVGVPIRQGRTIAVWETTVIDEAGRTTCISRCTVALRPATI